MISSLFVCLFLALTSPNQKSVEKIYSFEQAVELEGIISTQKAPSAKNDYGFESLNYQYYVLELKNLISVKFKNENSPQKAYSNIKIIQLVTTDEFEKKNKDFLNAHLGKSVQIKGKLNPANTAWHQTSILFEPSEIHL